MSAVVRAARPGDREEVTELLHRRMNAKIPRERWALLFDYPWRPADAPDCGRVLEDRGRIVGFLGATYVDRQIAGEAVRVCNMSSWYLLSEYRGRGHGRAMALSLTSDPAVTFTDLTATPQVQAMLIAHAGFAVLDAERWVLARAETVPPATAVEEGEPASLSLAHHSGLRDLRIVRAKIGSEDCTLALQVKLKGADVAYHQLLYVDEPVVLVRHAAAIANTILPEGAAVLAIDRRLVPEQPAGATLEPIPQPRLYKSRRLRADQIDNLYNEVLLLDQKLP